MLVNRNDKNVRKQHLNFSKIEIEYDTTIPHLGVHPEKSLIQKDACTSRFITALFTIAKAWKQPVSINRRMDEQTWYTHTVGYYSAVKQRDRMPFAATWREPETIILSKVSPAEKDKYHMISLIHGI